ncbi:beta-lactamase-like protein [Streptomyces subrutilus]|uniref:Beta-lactamase-like protein n=1 Tax=Streptomyces subrutilus TaxID=36818 RepID=A0A5P2UV37_9ACTN|nr:alkyl sulfatase dimerization domain-containing protein [Streptomyces subrutilus]QEU82209.1 MBL fold metallo-hydrolase [Streptomyces subrutilus]GGZ92145.1 beta-lactamase-like protein [Streptomyces subrutilus]
MTDRAPSTGTSAQEPTALTTARNAAVRVPDPAQDPEARLAAQGLVAKLDVGLTVPAADGPLPAWSLDPYRFLVDPANATAPPSVNPSLWRNAVLNMNVGLYEVVPDAVYQVRGMDISNISFLEDPTGASREIVVVDPLISEECAAAALDLYRAHRGDRTIRAVIFTHSHTDHYGGVRGLFAGREFPGADEVTVVAPDGFLEHAVSENVYAGNAMSRRATYMYGSLLHKDEKGQVDAGLGKTMSSGVTGLVAPTKVITAEDDGVAMRLGPVAIEFQLTPGTEAPAELNFYLPDVRSLCMAENATPTLHNLYSLRGAQVRDAKAWSQYLNEAVDRFGADATSLFASHFWPRWKTSPETDEIVSFLTRQADLYRFLHDQTLRLANHGRTMHEIAEDLDEAVAGLPLFGAWYNRGYYGTVNHDVKAVYQRYLGWYDGNAAHLHGLPPEKLGRRYVEAFGGADAVVRLARAAYDGADGPEDYRWAAELLSHVVFADPAHTAARELEADVLEQLGYQAESGPWRNFYLAGAAELRNRPTAEDGTTALPAPEIITADVIAAMPLDMIFDYLGIRLSGPEASAHPMALALHIVDGLEADPDDCAVRLRNGVLVYTPLTAAPAPDAYDASYTLTRAGLDDLALGRATPAELLDRKELSVDSGTLAPFTTLASLLDTFAFWFGLTTP